jgi:S1-C subfamily serine protease
MSEKKKGSTGLVEKVKQVSTRVLELALVAATLTTILYAATRMPEVHDLWIRKKVGNLTYKIQIEKDVLSGGTGSAMKAKSGQTVIVTNDHICEHAKNGEMYVTTEDGRGLMRKVLERSDFSDLCVIEGMPGDEGLSLGSKPGVGQRIQVVGHPLLRPLSLSSGEIVGSEDVKILLFIFPTGNPMIDFFSGAQDGKCDGPKNEIVDVPADLGDGNILHIKLCVVVTKNAYMSSAYIYPGNSGSPVVDFWGNVIGVAFAGDNVTNMGEIVSLDDLTKMLAKY